MMHQVKKTILPAVILAILMISQAVSAAPLQPAAAEGQASQLMYDNFDDNFTDPALWTIEQEGGPTASETNQRLEYTVPADSAGSDFRVWYTSTCALRGDHDIQVDYQLLNWPAGNGVRIGLAEYHANMQRISSGRQPGDVPGGPEFYLTNFDTAENIQGIVTTADAAGKLRIQRVGEVINTYYLAGGAWVLDATYSAPGYAEDTGFYLGAWSADSVFMDQEVKLAFDNLIINAGELICPSINVTIDQASGQADPTGGSPILFTATFSEPVTGFGDTAADVMLSGTAGATTATVAETAPNDGTTYTVSVSGMTASGTVIAAIPAGAAVNAINYPNTASTSSDNSVTYNMPATGQIIPITATCAQFAAGTAPDLDTVSYNLIFSKKIRVSEVSPTSFNYYSKVTAPAASFRIRVVQSANLYGWPFLLVQQKEVFDANCKVVTRHSTTTGNYIDFKVTNATPGAEYYVHTRYLAARVLGSVVTYPYPTVPYRFTTILNDYHIILSSIDTINFQPK